MQYIIPDKVYGVLKWAGLIACPALAVFVGVVGPAWGMDAGLSDATVTTLNAVGVLIGALLGVSAKTAKSKEE